MLQCVWPYRKRNSRDAAVDAAGLPTSACQLLLAELRARPIRSTSRRRGGRRRTMPAKKRKTPKRMLQSMVRKTCPTTKVHRKLDTTAAAVPACVAETGGAKGKREQQSVDDSRVGCKGAPEARPPMAPRTRERSRQRLQWVPQPMGAGRPTPPYAHRAGLQRLDLRGHQPAQRAPGPGKAGDEQACIRASRQGASSLKRWAPSITLLGPTH